MAMLTIAVLDLVLGGGPAKSGCLMQFGFIGLLEMRWVLYSFRSRVFAIPYGSSERRLQSYQCTDCTGYWYTRHYI